MGIGLQCAAVVAGAAGFPLWGGALPDPLRVGAHDRGAVVSGSIRDSLSGTAVAGVLVLLDGSVRDTSNKDGHYRIEGIGPGTYALRFFHPDHGIVLEGISYDLVIEFDEVEHWLDVRWPSIEALVAERCEATGGSRYGPVTVVGRVAGTGRILERGLRATIAWSPGSNLPPSGGGSQALGSFRSMAVAVQKNGGFLVCHLPAAQEVRLGVEDESGTPVGAWQTVTLPLRGVMTVRVPLRKGSAR
jgi:hypothetical protein